MTLNLSDEQLRSLQLTGGPVHLQDPSTQTGYVLLREDLFRRYESAEEFKPEHYYPLVNELMREDDEQDPLLERYQQY